MRSLRPVAIGAKGAAAMGVYRVNLVGEASYQQAIALERVGNRVRIEAEPTNPYDPDAIRIASVAGRTLGYIARDSWMQRAFHADRLEMSATISEINGGVNGRPTMGVVLEVRTAGDAVKAPPPVLPVAKSPALPARRQARPLHADVPNDRPLVSFEGGESEMQTKLTTEELLLVEQRVTNAAKSAGVAYLLWFFFWWASGHRFYMGRPGTAILQIVSYFVLVGFIWVVVDAFLIPGMLRRHNNDTRARIIEAMRAHKAQAA